MKLLAKIFIEGKIVLDTGLHIGGSKSNLEIGGVDNNVIKTAKGLPYIPGSSLKGKLRYLYAIAKGYKNIEEDEDDTNLINVFGIGAKDENDTNNINCKSRLIVRDAYLDEDKFSSEEKSKLFPDLELPYTEVKTENSIDRMTSVANPRPLERIPAKAEFKLDLVYNVFKNDTEENKQDELIQDIENLDILFTAFDLLEGDYLGGSGTRGSGKIHFEGFKFYIKTSKDYFNRQNSKKEKKGISIKKIEGYNEELSKLKEKIKNIINGKKEG